MWKSKEEIASAKAVSFQTVLTALNTPFSKVVNGQLLYFSPFVDEKTPSCLVDPRKNIMKDFSSGFGGDVIKFAEKLRGKGFIDAIDYLNSLDGTVLESPKKEVFYKISQMTLTDVKPLTSEVLLQYVYSRGISKQLADTYLKQIHYRTGGNNFVSLGFQNDTGGYELRSAPKMLNDRGFKGCLGYKAIRTIKSHNSHEVAIFEGFFSFLSYLQISINQRVLLNESNYIILNSLVNIKKVPFQDYTTIRLYLDNDPAGIKAAKKIADENPLKVVLNCSTKYSGYKDLNEYLLNTI